MDGSSKDSLLGSSRPAPSSSLLSFLIISGSVFVLISAVLFAVGIERVSFSFGFELATLSLAVASILVAFTLIRAHFSDLSSPLEQRMIIRIVSFVFVDALCSGIQIISPATMPYCVWVSFLYEAIVTLYFHRLLLFYHGGEEVLRGRFRDRPRVLRLFRFTRHVQVVNVLFHVIVLLAVCIMAPMGIYDVAEQKMFSLTFCINWINAAMLGASIFPLVAFIAFTRDFIAKNHPSLKFVTIKLIIFFGFVQRTVLSVLTLTHKLPLPFGSSTAITFNAGLYCLELFVFGHMNHYTFYWPDEAGCAAIEERDVCEQSFAAKLAFVLDPRDLLADIRATFQGKHLTFGKRRSVSLTESSASLRDC